MTMGTLYLFGGMAIFVSAILYSVVTSIFRRPHDIRKSRRPFTRRKSKTRIWIETRVGMTANAFLRFRDMTINVFLLIKDMTTNVFRLIGNMTTSIIASLYAAIPRIYIVPDGVTESPRSSTETKGKKRKTQPLSASRIPRKPLYSTKVSSRKRYSRSISSSSSGSSTPIATPSRGPSDAAENDTASVRRQATQVEKLQAHLTSSTIPSTPRSLGLSDALARLKTYMKTNLHIAPGASRLPALLQLVYNIHFTIEPDRFLPPSGPQQERYASATEIACVFLNRYGPIVWPAESEPAAHLKDRALQFPRDATIDKRRHQEWHALLVKPPAKGTAQDLAGSLLGRRMTKFVHMVYELPLVVKAEADWVAVAFVLDEPRAGEQAVTVDESEWSQALLKSIPKECYADD